MGLNMTPTFPISPEPSDDLLSYILASSDLTLLSSLFSSLPFNIYAKNKEGQFIFVTPAMAEMMEKTVAEILGKTDYDLHPPELARKYRNDDLKIMAGRERITLDEKWQTKTGDHILFVRACKVPFINQKTSEVIGTMGVFWDRTELILTEQELSDSQARYAAVIEQAREGIILIDPNTGKIIETNKAFQSMTGYSEQELLHIESYDILLTGESRAAFNNHISLGLKTYGPVNRTYICKDNSLIFTEVSAKFIQYRNLETILIVVRDVTERKKNEAEHKKLKDLLRRSQQLETIGVMAGGVAHDLNNILSGIVGYPDILLMNLPEDSLLRGPLMAIQESGKRAAAVVADLLTIARGAAHPQVASDVNSLIKSYLDSPEFKKITKDYPFVNYETSLEATTFQVLCSPIHVTKCIMNLVLNGTEAIDYSGIISIKTENVELNTYEARALRLNPGQYVVVRISNNGPPIPKNDLPHIFEPFFTKKHSGNSGTGLGLTIVWTTMQELDGTVTIQSEQKQTTFSLYFPALKKTNRVIQNLDTTLPSSLRGGSVLIIDDEKNLRDIGQRMFTHLGYQTYLAASGEEAVEFLKNNSVDLLLLDMQMPPGINGFQTYQQICSLHPHQPAIIVSGYATDDSLKKAQKLGPVGFIKKPYSFQDLQKSVREILAP